MRGADHAVLCTSGPRGSVDAVPVCFAVVGRRVVTPIDQVKPKRTTELGRVRNLDHDGAATLLCEHWDREDWSRLWWVRARLVRCSGHHVSAQLRQACEGALRAKYPQYRETEFADLIVFDVKGTVGWSAADVSGTAQSGAIDPLR